MRWNSFISVTMFAVNIRVTWTAWAVPAATNLAFRKPTRQSSTRDGGSSLVVNGDCDDFSLTWEQRAQWWMVDLLIVQPIEVIRVYTVPHLNNEFLKQASILGSTLSEPTIPALKLNDWFTIHSLYSSASSMVRIPLADPLSIRHLAISADGGRALRLAEVEIYGHQEYVNLAYGKTATNYPAIHDIPAALAINGNYSDFSKTEVSYRAWWKVDLGNPCTISSIRIYGNEIPKLIVQSVLFENSSEDINVWRVIRRILNPAKMAEIMEFDEPIVIGVLGLIAMEEKSLSFSEVEMFAPYNLAHDRPAFTESSMLNETVHPKFAVNGIYKDYTRTKASGKKWWRVDLLAIYYIDRIKFRLSPNSVNPQTTFFNIFTSKHSDPKSLSVGFDSWRNLSFNRPTYLRLTAPMDVEARHVALFSHDPQNPIVLAECVVQEYNFVLSGRITRDRLARHRLNATMDTPVHSTVQSNQFKSWSAALKKIIMFRCAVVYFESQIDNVATLLLITYVKGNQPTADDGMMLCYSASKTFPKNLIVECDRNMRHPPADHVIVYVSLHQKLEFNRVEVYGKVAPELKRTTKTTKKLINTTAIIFEFGKWTVEDTGSLPPDSYVIKDSESNTTQVISHHSDSTFDKVESSWFDLIPNKHYEFSINCRFRGLDLKTHVIRAMYHTDACSAPSSPKYRWNLLKVSVADGKISIKVSVEAAMSNCRRIKRYHVNIMNEEDIILFTKSKNSSGGFYFKNLDAGQKYKLSITIVNNIGLSSKANEIISLAAERPGRPILHSISFNSSCLSLDVSIADINSKTRIKLQFRCKSEQLGRIKSIEADRNARAQATLCGYPAESKVACELSAANSFGYGESWKVAGFTTTYNESAIYCPPPPKVPNANMNNDKITEIGGSVHYQCLRYYKITRGREMLVCVESDEHKVEWKGDLIQCEQLTYVAETSLTMAIITLVAIAIVFNWKVIKNRLKNCRQVYLKRTRKTVASIRLASADNSLRHKMATPQTPIQFADPHIYQQLQPYSMDYVNSSYIKHTHLFQNTLSQINKDNKQKRSDENVYDMPYETEML